MRRGEVGEASSAEGSESALDEPSDEPRDLVLARLSVFHDSNAAMVGEGRGVISSIAAICGEEIYAPGETEPAEECRFARRLGTRRGRLAAEALDRSLDSESIEWFDQVLLGPCISVRM